MDLRQRCHQATEVYSLRIVKQKWKIEKLAKVVFFLHSFFQNDYKLENKSERVGMLRSSPYQQITAGLSCHYRVFNIPVCMYCIAFHLSAVCLQLTYKTSFRGKGLFWPCCYVVAAHRWRHICKRSKNHSILILWQMIKSVDLANLLSIYHDTVNRISVISLKHTAVNQEIGFFRLEKKNTNLISLYLFSNDPIFHTFNK